jgi:hypothetical protein
MAKAPASGHPMSYPAAIVTDVAVGVAAGVVGALAMKAFQSAWINVTERAPKAHIAENAANALSHAIAGKPVRHSNEIGYKGHALWNRRDCGRSLWFGCRGVAIGDGGRRRSLWRTPLANRRRASIARPRSVTSA